MKTKLMLSIVAVGFAFVLAPRCLAGGPIIVVSPPQVVVSVPVPPPPVAVVVVAPDDYYWDGYEYVGIVGDQYYYLGSDNVWIVCDPVRLHRFHDWEGRNPDWHSHSIHNVKYRNMGHDRDKPQPAHESPKDQPSHRDDHSDHSDHDRKGPPQ